jgi:glutamate--cysteine ligase
MSEIPSFDELVAYFRQGEKPREDWVVGTEHEKIGVYSDDYSRVSYEGDRGIGVLLERIASEDDWERVYEGENVIALKKDGASITLEPGGQMELSGAPLPTIQETHSELTSHIDLTKRVSADLGITWLALGADPFHTIAEIPHMPKARYDIMRSYLPTRGRLALNMMHATATVQANYDYSDEADMAAKMRTAMGCTPIVSALFANSSIIEGRDSGFASQRLEVWRHMDPDRCGILPFVFERDFGYRDYAEWAYDVPMFFLVRDHRYLAAKGVTFRQFVEHGIGEHRATLDDWDLHLTTVFPEVRLKRFIEVRGADCGPKEFICALPALWKGLLYDAAAGEAASGLSQDWTLAERDDALVSAARLGLAGEAGGRPMLELAGELLEISASGLGRIAQAGGLGPDERAFLDPLRDLIAAGQSAGEAVRDAWRGEWNESRERLVEYARY